jgi:predicted alpha/beta-hydrolase family hydrolase
MTPGRAFVQGGRVGRNVTSDFLTAGPAAARCRIVLAHGAGAPMTSPFMEKMSSLLAERGLEVARFEFAYMAARRTAGARKPPPKAELLTGEYEAVVARLAASLTDGQRLVIGGKSMGGRIASMIAHALHGRGVAAGLVCLGYPFHPPGKPDKLRASHLETLSCPALIVQGERDPFGTRSEVAGYSLSPSIRLHWAPDGDHDLKPRRPLTHDANLAAAADAIAAFCEKLAKNVRPSDGGPSPPARARRT